MTIPRRPLLWSVLALSLVANAYQAYRIRQWSNADSARHARQSSRVGSRAQLFHALPMDSSSIVLFGDSHFEYFPATELLDLPNIKNRGLSGQTTRDLLERCADVVQARPRTIALCIGINDINKGRSLDDIDADLVTLLDTLHHGSPTSHLLVLSLPPNALASTQAKVLALNAILRERCAQRGLEFLDVTTPLMKDGLLDPSCTFDDLHLNAKGYRILAALLRTHL